MNLHKIIDVGLNLYPLIVFSDKEEESFNWQVQKKKT